MRTWFHPTTLEISHLLLMWVMYLDLTQNTGISPMSGHSNFHFVPLSNFDTSSDRTASYACAWDTFIKVSSTPSMHYTT